MLLLIENAEVLTPKPIGKATILTAADKILRIARPGELKKTDLRKLDPDLEVLNAKNCILTPGWIDPHEHLLGGSGESGFASQTPEITLRELVHAGITTVVGCLGVDSRMKTMAGLLARAKAMNEEGLTAYILSGGYNVPPTSIMNSLRDDLLFIAEVIGAGELAIADERCMEADARELARLVSDAHIGGMLSQKAGITHSHVGSGKRRLSLLRELLDGHEIRPEWLYPTHIERNEELLEEGIDLARRGCTVDMDVSEEDMDRWIPLYLERGGDPERVTLSSDASIQSPDTLKQQIRRCAFDCGIPMETLLPMVTSNVARVLKLEHKGRIREGADADLLALDARTLEPRHVVSRGRVMLRDGELTFRERFLEKSNRVIELRDKKAA